MSIAAGTAPFGYVGWSPVDQGLLAWTYDPAATQSTSVPSVAGRLEFYRLRLISPASVTNIVQYVNSPGSSLTSGQCFCALFGTTGTLIAQTADQSTAWGSNGLKTMALAGGPYSLASGLYTVGFWYNGTTSPGWVRGSAISSGVINAGMSSPFRFGTADTGLTTTAPGTVGAQTAFSFAWWGALS